MIAGSLNTMMMVSNAIVAGSSGDTQDEFSIALTFNAAAGGTFNLDPYGTPRLVFNVASRGNDAAGNVTTVNRQVIAMRVARLPHPNSTSLDVTNNGNGTLTARFILSEYIHTGDVITCTTLAAWYTGMQAETSRPVINDLSIPYFTPCGTWIRHDREIINEATYTPKLVIGHAYARNRLAVRAVRFILTDQTGNSVQSALVTDTQLETYSASGLSAEFWGTPVSLATLNQGDLVTVDAIIYPWIGDAFQLSVHGDVYPSQNLSTLRIISNRTGAYGTAYAYVSNTGNNTTGVVSATPATAEASPYLTIAAAAAAISVFNNANFGRNNASGGVIRLEAGTYVHATFASVVVGEAPLQIEAANPANRNTTIYQFTTSVTNGFPDRIKLKDLRLQKGAAGSITFIDMNATLATIANFTCVTENCFWDINTFAADAASAKAATVFRTGIYWSINDTGAAGQCQLSGVSCKSTMLIGGNNFSSMGLASSVRQCVASKDVSGITALGLANASSGTTQCRGNIIAYSHIGRNDGSGSTVGTDGVSVGDRGFMILGSVIEHFNNATTSPSVRLYGDSDITPVSNIHVQASTILGSRINFLYNDSGTASVKKYGTVRNSIIWNYNNKADLFLHPTDGQNGNRRGAWGVVNHTGFGYNAYLVGSASGDIFAVGDWVGETRAVGEISGTEASPVLTGFADDRSGAGTGNGNYRITGASNIPFVPATLLTTKWNLYGELHNNDGTDRAGAL